MLNEFVKMSRVKHCEVAEFMEMKQPSLCRILKGTIYVANEYYDKLYAFLKDNGATVPMRNGVVAYPSQTAKGAWNIYVEGKFLSTLVFESHQDLFDFLNEKDARLQMLKNYMVYANNFNNKVIVAGKKRKGRDFDIEE